MELACMVLAAGFSNRFGENKLLAKWEGNYLIEAVFSCIPKETFRQVIVVTRYDEIAEAAIKNGFETIFNKEENPALSLSIKIGMKQLMPQIEGCLFIVGDQPFLKRESIVKMCMEFAKDKTKIEALSYKNKRGNPVLFPKKYFAELANLKDGESGKDIIRKYEESLILIEAVQEKELIDIDTREELLYHTK